LKASAAYEAILLLDKRGICLASAPEGLADKDFSSDTTFSGALKGKLTISDAYKSDLLISVDPQSKGWTVAIAVPINGGNDFRGVLMSCLKWSRLQKLIIGVRVGETGYDFVLNGQNQVIIHPARHFYGISLRDPKINMPQLDDAVKKKLPNQRYDFKNIGTGRVDTKLVGLAYPKGYGNFPGLGWTVGTGADESEIVGGHPLWRLLFR